MSSDIMVKVNHSLDCKGLACPMPIVRTKKAIDGLASGQVIEVLATDKGSTADMQGWCKNTGHQYLGTITEDELLKHYIRKAAPDELKGETQFPHAVSNEQLVAIISGNKQVTVIDVREPAEYAFGHIPGTISIPLGDLEASSNILDPSSTIYCICRTGNRSDMACQLLAEKGFTSVYNVVPGMSEWTGATHTNHQ